MVMTAETEDIIDCMARFKAAGRPFALATVVRTEDLTAAKAGAKAVIDLEGGLHGWIGGGCTQAAARKVAARALADGRARYVRVRPRAKLAAEPAASDVELHASGCPSGGSIELFVEPVLPRPMLIVAGASPVARALAELGRGAGFAVTAAAAPEDHERLPQADHRIEGFDLGSAAGASSGFVVVATQGKRDREALQGALATAAPYVAFVGSRRKAAAMRESLLKAGADPGRLEALRAPAGLDIGAATPEEVALSILAEIVQQRRAAERQPGPPAMEREEIDGGSLEAEVVSPVKGACETKGREFLRRERS